MSPWLSIIGTGPDGPGGLPPAHKAALAGAEIVLSSRRILDQLGDHGGERHAWPAPLSDAFAMIENWRPRPVAVLATGDPMHFGIGAALLKHFSRDDVAILPNVSAFSLAAARLGWALQDAEAISLHGRPVAALRLHVQPGARLLALTEGADTVRAAAKLLTQWGFGGSALTVLENMGMADERIASFAARDCGVRAMGDFNLLAIDCAAGPDARVLPRIPGLPDEAFEHDGQLTKREIRAASLAVLAPAPGRLLWDVGAGCGSIAIEWMRAAHGARAIAFERNPHRVRMIAHNAVNLGVPLLEAVAGAVPEMLEGRPAPDAVFLGGAVASEAVFAMCREALKPGGRLVANAVTLEGEAALIARQQAYGGDLVRMETSHLDMVGARRVLRPRMAVLQWRLDKDHGDG